MLEAIERIVAAECRAVRKDSRANS
ncbi:hypothetical protein JOF55_004779 [Haloactinomyces albus]|uniref:Uncharacterized protein n=1 Tax=Haloactinomyces albus TaxID=1352928 RepID=A0AAE3ZIZ2_9ACTN|nr:hypothetical protein [Haloactinomyces albus]